MFRELAFRKTSKHSKTSKASNDFFTKLVRKCSADEAFLFGENEKKVYCRDKVFWLDFCNERNHRAIEFYGNWWHANPDLGYCNEAIWKHDEERLKLISEARL